MIIQAVEQFHLTQTVAGDMLSIGYNTPTACGSLVFAVAPHHRHSSHPKSSQAEYRSPTSGNCAKNIGSSWLHKYIRYTLVHMTGGLGSCSLRSPSDTLLSWKPTTGLVFGSATGLCSTTSMRYGRTHDTARYPYKNSFLASAGGLNLSNPQKKGLFKP